MKMSKKAKEFKAGDFIFAKVKGYPAWPARVQKLNGKKYFVFFYGTRETANLPGNMIFDYAENKEKFLSKQQKRRDFNEGVKQIEHDFANNVPVEEVVGTIEEVPADASVNETLNDSANETLNDSAIVDTSADETLNETPANVTQSDVPVEDSDDNLVIDEGKKGKKPAPKTPGKETPKAKEPKTPRGRAKKEDVKETKDEEKKEPEVISRSGRKIRPKRYIDEQIEENSTLPSPAAKKRRGTTPEKEKEVPAEEKKKTENKQTEKGDKNKLYNAVLQSELEELKEPIPLSAEKENILITYLPTGNYVGIKLFQSVPDSFKTEAAKLQWYKQQASNALSMKLMLERGQTNPQSVTTQLVTDLNLTDEEKATLDKERENEEKKSRVQFLKTEMRLIELDAKIKTCLCLEKADTNTCLKILDNLMELNIKPLMLLKHPTCVETVKRMRAYVGNTPCWGLSETDAQQFNKNATSIRKQADALYNRWKGLFTVPEGLSFWEFFSERVLHFKKATAKLTADELLEMVQEPIEMSQPTSHTMNAAISAANDEKLDIDEPSPKKRNTPAKKKKETVTPATSTPKSLKRQSSRNKVIEKEAEKPKEAESQNGDDKAENPTKEVNVEKEKSPKIADDAEMTEANPEVAKETESNESQKNTENEGDKATEKNDKEKQSDKDTTENDKDAPKEVDSDKVNDKQDDEENSKINEKDKEDSKSNKTETSETEKNNDVEKNNEAEKKDDEPEDKQKDNDKNNDKAKRSKEIKKTEATPPRSPAKRKAKV